MASSTEKRSAGSSDADQFLLSSRKKFKQEKPSTEIPIGDPESKSGVSRVFGTNESSSKGQENAGSSGKRKHSRWDATPQVDEQSVDDGVATTKRRKTRWANDDAQLKMLGPIHLPDFVKGSINAADDPKIQKLKKQLLGINQKLQSQESIDKLQRDVPLRERLVKQKQNIISELVRKNPTFDISSDFKQQKFHKKLYIPVNEYPDYNFIGLILGPHGRTQKRMEMETGARIMLRGKGSSKDGKTRRKDGKPDPSDDEDLHVLVEADSQKSLDAAMAMVEKLLVPVEDGKNELKRSQLRELAELNNTLRGENTHKTGQIASKTDGTCEICGDAGHYTVACPLTPPLPLTRTVEKDSLCETCGDAGHLTVACPFPGALLRTKTHENNVNFLGVLGGGLSPFTCPPFLGNQPLDFRSAVHSVPFGSDKFNGDVDYTNLYVAHLPQYVDVSRLVQLFSPFGALSYAKVIRDKDTGFSKGYGFVKYVDPTSAAMAVNQMNGYRLDGHMLAVRVAGNQHGTPGSMQPVEHTSISFPPACASSSAIAHIPASTCWPGPSGSMLPETSGLMCTPYGSSYTSPVPSSLMFTLSATSEELARFPGNPDNFASGYHSLFS